MNTNNNGSALLLEWINQERYYIGYSSPIYGFSQLMSTDFLFQLLQRVNPRYFSDLNHLSFEFQSYFEALQLYLIEVEGKKIARGYRKDILDNQSVQQIIKIVFFILLQTEQKTQYIARIVEMNVEVQSYLMQEIKKIQHCMENYVEIRDILTTVQKLQEENEALKERLKSVSEVNQQLSEVMLETKQENNKIEKELNRYEAEKKQILEELEIVDLKEYIEIYRGIKQENSELSYTIQQIEESRREAEHQNKAMKDRISEDCQIINQLNQQIVQLKTNYHQMKEQMSTLCISYDNPHQCLDDSVLRQNKNFGNVKVKLSLETTCSDRSLFLNNFCDDQQNNQNQKLRHLNNQIMHKLQNCYKTIADLTHQVTTLKDDKSKLQKKNIFLEKKMGDLKKEQSRFMRELKKMGF